MKAAEAARLIGGVDGRVAVGLAGRAAAGEGPVEVLRTDALAVQEDHVGRAVHTGAVVELGEAGAGQWCGRGSETRGGCDLGSRGGRESRRGSDVGSRGGARSRERSRGRK